MLIDSQSNGTIASKSAKGSAMTVNITGTSFNFILDNLYTYPHRAIVRELSCNAWDAQIQAKNPEPFHIQVPSKFNPTFMIRDFGVGLDAEEIDKYLNTLYQSSKTTSNEQIGGFGLGAKSPFALVQSFFITSYKNGIEYKCFWYRDAEGIPILKVQSQKPTEEVNGIKYVINFNDVDVDKIALACATELISLPVAPRFFNDLSDPSTEFDLFGNSNLSKIIETDDYIVISDPEKILTWLPNTGNSSHYRPNPVGISIGGVNYSMISSVGHFDLQKVCPDFFKIFNVNSYVFLAKLPIGKLKLPSTREHILDTAENKEYCLEEVPRGLQSFIDDVKTEYKDTIATGKESSLSEHFVKLPAFCSKSGLNYRYVSDVLVDANSLVLDGSLKEYVEMISTSPIPKASILAHYLNVPNKSYVPLVVFKSVDKTSYRTTSSHYCMYNSIHTTPQSSKGTLFVIADTPKFMGAWLAGEEDIKDYSLIYRCAPPSNITSPEAIKKFTEITQLIIKSSLPEEYKYRVMLASELVKPEQQASTTTKVSITDQPVPGIRTCKTIHSSYNEANPIFKMVNDKGNSLPFGPEYVSDLKGKVIYFLKDGPSKYIDWALQSYVNSLLKAGIPVTLFQVRAPQESLFKNAFKDHPNGVTPIVYDTIENIVNLDHIPSELLKQYRIFHSIMTAVPDQEFRKFLIKNCGLSFDQLDEEQIERMLNTTYNYTNYSGVLKTAEDQNFFSNVYNRFFNNTSSDSEVNAIDNLIATLPRKVTIELVEKSLASNTFLLSIIKNLLPKE